jgi:hypothetical protein
MKNRILFFSLFLWLTIDAQSQEFNIASFQENILDLRAATNPVKDNNGEVCAIIIFPTSDDNFIFEPNLGIVKKVNRIGETWLYVPQHTKRMTIRHPQLGILRNYSIPITIRHSRVYEAELQITNKEYLYPQQHPVQIIKTDTVYVLMPQESSAIQEVKTERRVFFEFGAGFRAFGIMGPEAFIGIKVGKHTIEAGAIYGVSKVLGLNIYQVDNSAYWGTYNFRSMRIFFHYGFDIKAASFLTFTPQLGGAINNITGKEVHSGVNSDIFNKINTISVSLGCRVGFRVDKIVSFQLTPSYDFGVKKDRSFIIIKDASSKVKSWTDGFSISGGLIIQL